MIDALNLCAAAIALSAVASVAFVRPYGALWRSFLAGGFGALGAAVSWRLAIGGADAGLTLFTAGFLVLLAAAALASSAVLLRHALNAAGARALPV